MLALFGFSSDWCRRSIPAILGIKGSLFLTRPGLNQYMATRDELMSRMRDIFAWLASGKLKIRIGHVSRWPRRVAHTRNSKRAGPPARSLLT
jgi:NADPH2:quinone reductase